MKFEVDRKMLPMKGHFFFFNAGTAPVVPFMPTLARQLGFSSVIVGTIYTILPVVGLLIKPVSGAIADKFQKRKIMFLAFQLLTAVAFFGIKFIRPLEQTVELDFHCNDGVSDLKYCSNNGSLNTCEAMELTRERTDGSQNNILQCTMTCHINETWQAEAICVDWQGKTTGDCDLKRSSFDLAVNVKMGHIEFIEKCLLFSVHDAHLVTSDNSAKSQVKCPRRANSTHYFRSKCNAKCSERSVMQAMGSNHRLNEADVMVSPQLWIFFTLMVLSWAGMAAVVSLGDAICFQMLGEKHALYGNQRLWGAVGWGIFSILAGLLVDEMSRGQGGYKDYSGVFYMMVILIGLDLLVSYPIKQKQTTRSSNIMKDIGVLFLSPAICVFFIWCILIGLCTALIWNFLFWHLEELSDAETGCNANEWMKTLQGLAMGIQCFGGELPFFFVSGAILQRIGHIHAMSLVLLGFGIRFILYSLLTNPWWVLPIELMQGVTFGIFYSTMASYASLVAPPGTESTLQGLVGAIFEGFGVSSGSFIGGYAMENLGGSSMFRLFGAIALAFFVLHVVAQKLLEKCACYSDKGGRLQYSAPVDALTMLSDDDHYPERT